MYGDYELKHLAEAFEGMVKDGKLKGVAPMLESAPEASTEKPTEPPAEVTKFEKPAEPAPLFSWKTPTRAAVSEALTPEQGKALSAKWRDQARMRKSLEPKGLTPEKGKALVAKWNDEKRMRQSLAGVRLGPEHAAKVQGAVNTAMANHADIVAKRNQLKPVPEGVELADRLEAMAEGLEALQEFSSMLPRKRRISGRFAL